MQIFWNNRLGSRELHPTTAQPWKSAPAVHFLQAKITCRVDLHFRHDRHVKQSEAPIAPLRCQRPSPCAICALYPASTNHRASIEPWRAHQPNRGPRRQCQCSVVFLRCRVPSDIHCPEAVSFPGMTCPSLHCRSLHPLPQSTGFVRLFTC